MPRYKKHHKSDRSFGSGLAVGLGVLGVAGAAVAWVLGYIGPELRGIGTDRITAYFAGYSDGRRSLEGIVFRNGPNHLASSQLLASYRQGWDDAVARKAPTSPAYTDEEWAEFVKQDAQANKKP